ncbi:3',5'-cyclic AMP phosphodiesterase CpdA [Neorhizobium huautlense]|uniref:3',5'-cyclic AMP phosphodiesterase CpdA n=1 Tax=Neorhizobium huautlense TaxID=67774 RepID=A0ABT9PZD1_9HYPH|nr:metallophosphoesterase [Neorhizobium huautlense]MDP9839797.1 3',5'-cyclic AMP phosphodiesterase CpdA [Neorhizobium huautlense]
MLIAHISDFHLFANEPETPPVRLDIERVARRIVDDLANFSPTLDAVAFTGDVADGGSTADYDMLKDVLAPLKVPVLIVPGNHDRRANLRAAFADRLPFETGSFLNYETQIDGLRVLALDTLVEGEVAGALAPESIEWLTGKLDRRTKEPTLILLHHPPFPSGIKPLDGNALIAGREEIATLVRNYGGSLILLAGHIHRPYQAIWNGAYCAVGGSPAFQVSLDLAATVHEPGCITEPYSYFVYRIEVDGTMAVHTRHIPIEN